MPTESASGTQTAVISTEHTLFNSTLNKTYVGYVNLENMASGDTTEIRVKIKVLSSGTQRQYDLGTYTNAQTSPVVFIPPLATNVQYTLTLKQTGGTGRAYEWKIFEYD